MNPDRRQILSSGLAALLCRPAFAQSEQITDDAGRSVPIPAAVTRVLPAGPPASILLYTAAPELLLGWSRALRPEERTFLLPEIASRPEVGRLTGRGNTANLEVIIKLKPDLIVDVGSVTDTYVSLADRVQSQTGIPYALLDGRLDRSADAYRLLGKLIRQETRLHDLADQVDATLRAIKTRVGMVPEAARPRVYYARGEKGLETGLGGSINVESIEFMGARNVAGDKHGGLATISMEQILVWNPEVIITIDPNFARNVPTDPSWTSIAAVRAGRVHLSPRLPFGWIDFPPSVNRLIGLWWLGRVLYPAYFPEDLRPMIRDFYHRFYHVTISDDQVNKLLEGRA
jgi:iron complex transport system substrate-binding protein